MIAGMLRLLLLVLFMVGLAVPALALPVAHGHAATSHAGHGGTNTADHDGLAPSHQCIGCIAPLHGLPTPPSPTLLVFQPEALPLPSEVERALPKPATPPPRA